MPLSLYMYANTFVDVNVRQNYLFTHPSCIACYLGGCNLGRVRYYLVTNIAHFSSVSLSALDCIALPS